MAAEPELYLGLMSGTSMDAVDAVLVEFGRPSLRLLATHSQALDSDLRQALLALASGRSPHPLQRLGELDAALGDGFARAASAVLGQAGVEPTAVTAIGSHGQTVYHQPEGDTPFTLQIGDPNRIAQRTGITTVADFRRRDMAVGGQGAPLVPAFHADLFRSASSDRAVVNIGGMANVTLLPCEPAKAVIGFDTGPGNVLMDGWVGRHRGQPYDNDGAWAATGEVLAQLLEELLADSYFARRPPKSTGREHFNLDWLERHHPGGRTEDVQATLCELTARSIAAALNDALPTATEVGICGGGAYNRELMSRLAEHLPGATVVSTAAWGLEPRWVEAAAFAWLARQTLAGRPGNLPSVTGASEAVVLGGIYLGGGKMHGAGYK